MVQTVRFWPLTAEAWILFQVLPCEICDGKKKWYWDRIFSGYISPSATGLWWEEDWFGLSWARRPAKGNSLM